MSHARIMATPHDQKAPPPSLRRASLETGDDTRDSAAEALTVTPACDRVYVYTVPASSEWTTTDLLRTLHDLVHPATRHNGEAPGATEPPAAP